MENSRGKGVATPSSSMEEEEEPRRSGRARISTTMTIDGHTVLRMNNYSVTGMQYIYHNNNDEEAEEEAKEDVQPPPCKKTKTKSSPHSNKVRVCSASEQARKHHNDTIVANIQKKQVYRKAYLSKHVEIIEPFVEEQVLEHLLTIDESSSNQKKKNKHNNYNNNNKRTLMKDPPMIHQQTQSQQVKVHQPKMIQGTTLRVYQMKGLEFLVRMHQQNLSCILGDEMGL